MNFFSILVGFALWTSVLSTKRHLSSEGSQNVTEAYLDTADKIRDYLLQGSGASVLFNELAELTDTFGPRPAGSNAESDAIDHIMKKMRQDGLENVHTETVPLRKWTRGVEEAVLLQPIRKKLEFSGHKLGCSTPPGGVTAKVIVVKSFEQLKEFLSKHEKSEGLNALKGKIWTIPELGRATDENMKKWAFMEELQPAAYLYKAWGHISINSPHVMLAVPGGKGIPRAMLTQEDMEMLERMHDRGDHIEMHLNLHSTVTENFPARNLIAEIRGASKPEEIVMICGHIDSVDTGYGAMDNGGGALLSWHVLRSLKQLNLRPQRTIRAALFTAEEYGAVGSRYYHEMHNATNMPNESFVYVMESDSGAFQLDALDYFGPNSTRYLMRDVLRTLAPINGSDALSDMRFLMDGVHWMNDGVPAAWFTNMQKRKYYSNFHHTKGDNVHVFDSSELDLASVAFTTIAYIVADMDQLLMHTSEIDSEAIKEMIHAMEVVRSVHNRH